MSKPVFGCASRSVVWDHFTKSADGKSATCRICRSVCVYHGKTTSNLHAHLKSQHPSVVSGSAAANSSTPSAGSKLMTDFAVSQRSGPQQKQCGTAQAEAISQLLVNWVTGSMRPLNIVKDPGLQSLLAFLQPGYRVLSRTHLTAMIRSRFESGRKELRELLADVEYVAITTDGWTSKAFVPSPRTPSIS